RGNDDAPARLGALTRQADRVATFGRRSAAVVHRDVDAAMVDAPVLRAGDGVRAVGGGDAAAGNAEPLTDAADARVGGRAPVLIVARRKLGPARVSGTSRPGAGAVLGRVADASGGTAGDGRGLELVARAVRVRAVAALRHVADTGQRATDRRELHVGRACRRRPGALLGGVAHAGR